MGTIYNTGIKKEKTDETPTPLASTINFNRHRLYYKDDSTGIVKYVPLSECGIINSGDSICTPYFIKENKEEYKWDVENPMAPPGFTLLKTNYKGEVDEETEAIINYKLFSEYSEFESDHWTQDYERPQNLLFWFDFIDAEDYNKYSCKEIGTRPIVKKESSVGSISYNSSPAVYYDESFQIPE
jgi:hypothetical protein